MKRFFALLLICLLLLAGCGQEATDPAALYGGAIVEDEVNLLFLSVGQGDACLVTFPTGEQIMIDAGPLESRDRLVDQLHALGVERLDALFLTHGHADHTGNALTLVRRFDVPVVYYGGAEADYGNLLGRVRRRGAKLAALREGGAVTYGDATLTVLNPLSDRLYEGLNDASAVLRLTYGATSALFMADATAQTEEYMLFRYHRAELHADVMKVAHHGSASSSTLRFVRSVSPSFAVISVGRGNAYGHPAPSALLRLGLAGARVLRTDEAPAVQITLDGRGARVVE